MKTIVKVLIIPLLLSCNKEKITVPPVQEMEHFELNDSIFKLNSPIVLDINKDGRNDLLFHTEFFTGYPNDYTEYRVVPQIESAVVALTSTPKVFNKDETIRFENAGFTWVDDPVVLAKRVYEIELENSHWDGAWKDKQNKYLGLQLTKNGQTHLGWLRLSVINDKGWMVLHDAAVSRDPDKNIIAGKVD